MIYDFRLTIYDFDGQDAKGFILLGKKAKRRKG